MKTVLDLGRLFWAENLQAAERFRRVQARCAAVFLTRSLS
jgi:hypothetical protein